MRLLKKNVPPQIPQINTDNYQANKNFFVVGGTPAEDQQYLLIQAGAYDHDALYGGFINMSDCAYVTVQNTILTGRKTYMTIGRAGDSTPNRRFESPEDYQGPAIFANFNSQMTDETYIEAFPYIITKEVFLKNVTTASGKPLRLSDNLFMFRDVKVEEKK
jgi:hypothetical protein